MTRLLISVRSAREAKLIADLPVGVIDVKEPRHGSLGRPSPRVLREVRNTIGNEHALSAALGELVEAPPWEKLGNALPGYHFAKVGLAGAIRLADWRSAYRSLIGHFPPHVIPVAVAYADWSACAAPSPGDVLEAACQLRCGVVLFDTYFKSGGDLFHWITDQDLERWIKAIRRHEMLVALAGSITLDTLPRYLELAPDLVGIRGAACRRDRKDTLCRRRVELFCERFAVKMPPRVI